MHTLADDKTHLSLEQRSQSTVNRKTENKGLGIDQFSTSILLKKWELLGKESIYNQARRERMGMYKHTHY